jgi:hypothetical protein
MAEVDRQALGRASRSRGIGLENKVKGQLERDGYTVYRVTHGAADLIAGRVYKWLGKGLLIQVKGTIRPYDKFGPKRREELRRDAEALGMKALLIHWPKGAREPTWLFEWSWPT